MAEATTFIELHNRSTVPQPIYDEKGVKHVLEALEMRPLPEKIAKQFLAERGKFVTIYTPTRIPIIEGEERVWVCNGTGNPFVPKTITLPPMEDGEEPIEIPHPLLEAKPLHFPWHPGQLIEKDD